MGGISLASYGLRLTTDAARRCLDWLRSPTEDSLATLLAHPGYQAVLRHSRTLSFAPITEQDFWRASRGEPSNLYGLRSVLDNAYQIECLVAHVELYRPNLLRHIANALLNLLDPVYWQNTGLHCIVGYDASIGIGGQVAINLNWPLYRENRDEIPRRLLHAAVHVAYERIHGPMYVDWLGQPGGLRRYLCTLVQKEGLALYAATPDSPAAGPLTDADQQTLAAPARLRQRLQEFAAIIATLERPGGDKEIDKILPIFSDQRLAFVVGAYLFRTIAAQEGPAGVRRAAMLPALEFIQKYRSLLQQPLPSTRG